jgi:ABC-type protease/lipase transport system fused ATPase/permease subunit
MRSSQGAGTPRDFSWIALRLLGGKRVLGLAFLLTLGINVLALTGPAYMLLLYDRVLPLHDGRQLAALTALMLVLYALGGILDLARHGLFLNCARRLDRRLSIYVAKRGGPLPIRDLDNIRAFLAGQAPAALFDLPWVPLYLGGIFLLHPLFGLLATAGGALLIGCIVGAERRGAALGRTAAQLGAQRWAAATSAAADAIEGRRAWRQLNARLRHAQDAAAQPSILAAAVLRAQRPALQSAMLGLGAYLVMIGACHPAGMLAASIMLTRVLGPLETAIVHWRSFAVARQSASRLRALLLTPLVKGPPQPSQDRTPPQLRIILRSRSDYARRAIGAGARSASSGLRPTAE